MVSLVHGTERDYQRGSQNPCKCRRPVDYWRSIRYPASTEHAINMEAVEYVDDLRRGQGHVRIATHQAMHPSDDLCSVKMNEKYHIMSPFDITSKVLGPYLFSSTARETLGEKMEYYFQDHSFVPLFIQENYLKPQPSRAKNFDGVEKQLKELELMDAASSSISDGDLVDALIHG